MNRTFSVIRRRPRIVDMLTPRVDGVVGYRVKASTNFDVAPTTLFTSTNVGFVDTDGVDQRVIESQPTQGQVRMVWNPTTFGLQDGNQLWLSLWHVDAANVETQVSAPTLMLPDQTQFLHRGAGHVLVRGFAPVAVSVAGSLQLDFPRLMCDWRVRNEDATNSVFIAFEPNGPEYALNAPDTETQFMSLRANAASIWVRAAAGTPILSIHATVANPI